jgi:phage baseplate assembly protein W
MPDDQGRLAFPTVTQGVREMIEVILGTRPGEQLRRPGFGAGLENLLTEPNTLTTRSRIHDLVTAALARWEPRIVVDAVAVDPLQGDPGAVRVEIAYRIRRTQQPARVGVTLLLEGARAA